MRLLHNRRMHYICLDCLKEPYLRQTLKTEQQVCDYCEMDRPCAGLFDVAYECDRVLETHFEPTHLEYAVVYHDREPVGSPLWSTLEDLKVVRSEAIDDLIEDLNFLWFDRDSMENKYSLEDEADTPWFRLRADLGEPVSEAWAQMNRSLQQEARYVNPQAMRVLETVLGNIDADHTDDGEPVVIAAGPATELTTLFRARVFQLEHHLTEALGHPARLLGTPAPGIGQAGRMNAKGQPAFYGATTVDVAIAEVRPPVGAWVATAAFELARPVRLLDLRSLNRVRIPAGLTYFDPTTTAMAQRRDFLKTLSSRLVQPVMPDLQERDYLVTQVIADYLATREKGPIDGIIYPSVQRPDTDSAYGFNVALFARASTVAGASGKPLGKAYLWEHEEEDSWIEPWIVEPRPVAAPAADGFDDIGDLPSARADHPPETLRLVKDKIAIHKITGIQISRIEHQVRVQP